jgi:ABC-type dipeptide/oligopeptide/nickel transport system permease component
MSLVALAAGVVRPGRSRADDDGWLGQPVAGLAFASTVFVFVSGLAIAYAIGQWLGRATGWRGGLRSDGITIAGVSLSTLFPPFVGFVITSVLALRLRRWRAEMFEDRAARAVVRRS